MAAISIFYLIYNRVVIYSIYRLFDNELCSLVRSHIFAENSNVFVYFTRVL